MFKNDGWFAWCGDPERAFREHDPGLEPYASMSRAETLAAMLAAKGVREWEFLREFLIDKLSQEELEYDHYQALLADCGGFTSEEIIYLDGQAGMATRLILFVRAFDRSPRGCRWGKSADSDSDGAGAARRVRARAALLLPGSTPMA